MMKNAAREEHTVVTPLPLPAAHRRLKLILLLLLFFPPHHLRDVLFMITRWRLSRMKIVIENGAYKPLLFYK